MATLPANMATQLKLSTRFVFFAPVRRLESLAILAAGPMSDVVR